MTRQASLGDFEPQHGPDLSVLTDAERDAYEAVELGEKGPREYQRDQGYSSPGTVSNLLARAREKLEVSA